MIPAEARRVIDTLASAKHTEDHIRDAIECMQRIVSPSHRDRVRVSRAIAFVNLMEKPDVV